MRTPEARLAQSAERKALNLVVVGSSPTVGVAMERCSWQHREQTCQFLRRLLFVSGNQPCPFGGPMDREGRGLLHRIAAGRTAGMEVPDDPAAALVTCRQLCPVSAVLGAWVCRDALPIRWPRLSHGAAAHACPL